jgi:hypothetical protein
MYVVCSSPQEDPLSPEALENILATAAARDNCRGVVMPIQPNKPHVRLSMEQIVDAALREQFQVSAFVIDPGRDAGASRLVERRLRGSSITPITLDGRRFSLLNARLINDASHIVS